MIIWGLFFLLGILRAQRSAEVGLHQGQVGGGRDGAASQGRQVRRRSGRGADEGGRSRSQGGYAWEARSGNVLSMWSGTFGFALNLQ